MVRRRQTLLMLAAPIMASWIGCGDTGAAGVDQPVAQQPRTGPSDIDANAGRLLQEGREIFRFDTFGDEAWWGGQLQLHEAIAGADLGGVGPGLSPVQALALGLKVDVEALPDAVVQAIQAGTIDLESPATTVALLQADAVLGLEGFFEGDTLSAVGITCAFCHSTVDDSITAGIGRRLDGWPNRDLDVGRIVALAPNLAPLSELLGVGEATVRTVLESWGPGKFDAVLNMDGRAFRPDGGSGATLIPAAFGMAGVNLHTYTGWGSVPYWNAYVANTQMFGQGTFFDPRLNDPEQYPIAVRTGRWNVRSDPDLITAKLPALHFYQLAIPAPEPPAGSFDAAAAARGEVLFNGEAQCARCHVPPLFTEPGWQMHTAEEMDIDDFQASRSPDERYYRTTPLGGLFTRTTGGFYHDGRFPDLSAVVAHYEQLLGLDLSADERADLIEYLKSL